jgi:RNA polymerase sigma-70 factor (ECF subfamily)
MDTVDADTLDRADLERLVAGHDAALDALMERHATAVFHFLCRMLGNEDDANDLAQETFIRVYRSRESYKPQHRFSTWLFTIAANLARSQLRWRSRHPNVSLDSESGTTEQPLASTIPANTTTPHEAAATAERHEAVRAAVQALPSDLREAVVLCEWQDMAVAEAAAVLQCTPKAVESRLYRARGSLRTRLSKWL